MSSVHSAESEMTTSARAVVGRRWRAGSLAYTTPALAGLFAWLLWGDFAWMLKERSVLPVAQVFLKIFEASDLIVGLLVGSLPAALGMILGPVVSVRSDRHRGRWGRRIPFLLISTPFAAFAMMGLAFTPRFGGLLHVWLGSGSPGESVCVLIAFALFWTVFEVASVIGNAVLGGLINDVVPPEVIGRFFGLFRAVGLIAGIVFNFWLMGYAETHYFWIFISVGAIYGVGFTLMCLRVKEGDYPPPPMLEAKVSWFTGIRASITTYLRECFTHRYYLWVFAATTLATLAFVPFNTFAVFHAKSVGVSMDAFGKYLAVTFAVSFALSFPLGWLADRFHPLRVGIAAMALHAAVALWSGLTADDARSYAVAFVLHGILAGTYYTATASIGQRLYPRARFAQFASAAGLLGSASVVIVPPLMGWYLDTMGHVYRHTLLVGAGLAVLALVALVVVNRRFMALGGPKGYMAPE